MGTRTEPDVADRDEAGEAAAASVPPRRRLGAGAAATLALGLAIVIVVSDQVTKAAITARYGPCGNLQFHPVFGTFAGFSYVCNTGTAFSRFAGNPLVWIPVGLAAAAVCWLWVRSLAAPHLAQQIAFGLILGGAAGNLIDRARLGYVVDFIDLRLTETLRWYVFNVADASVCIGVALLALAYWRATARE
ncbi:MAG TPA: signal peptidase II [Thermomicrobiales bacterium]|nr:signal peptidase II [Thermomicrobiales bacterium]